MIIKIEKPYLNRLCYIWVILMFSLSCKKGEILNTNRIVQSVENKDYNINLIDSDLNFDLSVSLYDEINFLEHIYSWKSQSATDSLICFDNETGDILFSENLGKSFKRVVKGDYGYWTGCITTNTGRHMLWEDNSQMIWIYSKDWHFIKKIKTGNFPWHGSWSIAELNGTIIYAEYADNAEILYVWRSVDDGETWKKTFFQNGRLSNNNQIRHFHTVQPDPFNSRHWYLSSGDYAKENKIWLSIDDGLSWKEVTDPDPEGTNLQNVHRYTAVYFTKDFIYWGTDDLMDGTAKLVRARRSDPLEIQVVCDLGNVVRSMITTSKGAFFISEQKLLKNGSYIDATVHFTPDFNRSELIISLPNLDNIETGFTYSRSSIASKDGVFFTYFGGHVLFNRKHGFLKWVIKNGDNIMMKNIEGI
jgi:hypothetical protein